MTNSESFRDQDESSSTGSPRTSYSGGSERDIHAKQTSDVQDSQAFDDKEIDASKVEVLPGTGGPDDTGYMEVEPEDYNRTGH